MRFHDAYIKHSAGWLDGSSVGAPNRRTATRRASGPKLEGDETPWKTGYFGG